MKKILAAGIILAFFSPALAQAQQSNVSAAGAAAFVHAGKKMHKQIKNHGMSVHKAGKKVKKHSIKHHKATKGAPAPAMQ